MSEIKVNSIKGVGASVAAITVNNTDGTCTANLTNRTNKNLIINGAMQVAQRGTSSTDNGYATVDRFKINFTGTDEAPTQAQVDVGSSDLPFTKGLTKAFKITNGNQTSGAGAGDRIAIQHRLEAQDVRNSGWNYTSTSSYVTLSFYVKSSVAQNFYGRLYTSDGTSQNYPFETGSLSADTWTKVTKTISGNSNLTFDNDSGRGLDVEFTIFRGTNETGSVSLNQWAAFSSSTYTPDMTSTWYTTNDATFEITGVQLEVGSVATDFEHLSFADELRRCQRYFFSITGDSNVRSGVLGYANSSSEFRGVVHFPVTMRANPTLTGSSTNAVIDSADDSATFSVSALSMSTVPQINQAVVEVSTSSMTAGQCGQLEFRANNGFMKFDAEL